MPLTDDKTSERPARKRRRSRSELKRDLAVVAIVTSVMAVLDYVSYNWFVPWADAMTSNKIMSLGYIVAFFVVFCNFLVFFALVAYVLQRESYASDEWQ